MDELPIVRPRTPDVPLGYLNYPPEIMNKIYQEVLVDNSQIFAFLCSLAPQYRIIGLKQAVAAHQSPRYDVLDWTHLLDARYYTDSHGLSAQFLRVCKKIWSEASPVLYGNLTIALRWDIRQEKRCGDYLDNPWQRSLLYSLPENQPESPSDPCIERFFKRNAVYVIAWADFVYPTLVGPLYTKIPGGTAYWYDALHWGMTHQTAQADPREQVLLQLYGDKEGKKDLLAA